MSGQVKSAVHSSDVPASAPAIEYVAMPEGSSSAAAVITPGPKILKNPLMREDCFARKPERCEVGGKRDRSMNARERNLDRHFSMKLQEARSCIPRARQNFVC